MTSKSKQHWNFGWVTSAMHSARNSRQKKRLDRFKLIAERELRLNEHMLRDIGLTTDDVKNALTSPRSWF